MHTATILPIEGEAMTSSLPDVRRGGAPGAWAWHLSIASFCLVVATCATAQRALALDDPRVEDDAGFFSADAVTKANATIKQIKQDHNIDVMIETFAQIPSEL